MGFVLFWFIWLSFSSLSSSEKNENPLRIDKVIAMSLVYYVFGTQCRIFLKISTITCIKKKFKIKSLKAIKYHSGKL